jgi:stage V sporulation protein T
VTLKATGIVRRIDDLGRVVIPKEIRRTLRIREGDPLEIFVDRDGEVILKKYSPIGDKELSDDSVLLRAVKSGEGTLVTFYDHFLEPLVEQRHGFVIVE